jgi:hypothetical protein
MQLCFGCLHNFPEESLTPVQTFGAQLTSRMQSIRSLMSKVHATNAQTRQCVASMEDELRRLTLAVDGELRAKETVIAQLSVQLKYFSDNEEEIERRMATLEKQRPAARPPARTAEASPVGYSSKMLERFIAASNALPPAGRRPGSRHFVVANRFGDGVVVAQRVASAEADGGEGGTPRRGAAAGVPRPLDLVSASIFNALEFASVRARAAIGVLWLQVEDNDELVAPFIIGSEVKQGRYGVAPFHIRIASTTAGTVLTTGIAANVLRPATRHAPEDTLQQTLQQTSRSTLFLPVFKRFGEADRVCHGVLQMIAWPHASPFTVEDEVACTAVAHMMSHTLTQYGGAFAGDWTSRTYDPSAMTKGAAYFAGMEQLKGNAERPGYNVMDDCVSGMHPPVLIHRSDATKDGLGGAVTQKISRQEIHSQGVQHMSAKDALKDVHRYTTTLEASWKQAVGAQTELNRKNEALLQQLEQAKLGLLEARRGGGGGGPGSGGFAREAREARRSVSIASPVSAQSTRRGSSAHFSAAELDDLENETSSRLKTVAKEAGAPRAKGPERPPTKPPLGARPTAGGGNTFITAPSSSDPSPRTRQPM